jgi:hypothetical protein
VNFLLAQGHRDAQDLAAASDVFLDMCANWEDSRLPNERKLVAALPVFLACNITFKREYGIR